MFNGAAREVVGVLPEDFRFLRANPLVVVPQKIDRATIHAAGFNYQGIARLKPGVIDRAGQRRRRRGCCRR